jgi:hypothetical protein
VCLVVAVSIKAIQHSSKAPPPLGLHFLRTSVLLIYFWTAPLRLNGLTVRGIAATAADVLNF